MIGKTKKVTHIFFLLIYFVFLFIQDNIILFLCISSILFLLVYRTYSKMFKSKAETLVVLLVFSVPLSFVNILGMPYGSFPLSWFNIFILLFIFSILFNKKKKSIALNGLSLISIIYGLYLCIPILISFDKIDAMQQVLNLVMFIVTIVVVNRKNFSINSKDILQLYCNVTYYISIAVIFQLVYFNFTGIITGQISFYATRVAIGYLFSDVSFLSIYLASGLVIMILTTKRYYFHINFFVIFLACVMTSARTGIVSFIIIYVLFLIVKSINQLNRNPFKYFFFLLMTPTVLLFLLFIIKKTRPSDYNLSSGRIESYLSSLQLLKENWAFGVGLGVDSFFINNGQVIPHNIFVQFLVQTGILGFLLLVVILTLITINIYRSNKKYIWIWLLILLGAQFIPDIIHSRFIIVIAIILLSNNFLFSYLGKNADQDSNSTIV